MPDVTRNGSPPPLSASSAALERLRQGLSADSNAVADADTSLKLVEAVRSLAVRHGPPAVDHCVKLVQNLRDLLDGLTAAGR